MARRFEGFVVGRQTVQQQKGWKIGRRTHRGKVNSFAPETEFVEGFEMFAGVEVTFFTEMRDGRSFALNVQPKTATMEDSMRKLKLGLVTTFILVIIALMGIFKPYQHEPIRSWIVEIRAEWALDSIRTLTADQIITDEVVREVVRNRFHLWSASRAAREAVFAEHQCQIFSIVYDDVEQICHVARYGEGVTTYNPWYERVGIPVSIAPTIAEMRDEVYRIGRNYLMTPANVRAVYEAKRSIIAEEYHLLPDEGKQRLLELLSIAIAAFEQFRDDDTVSTLYSDYIRLENAWRVRESAADPVLYEWVDAGAVFRTAVVDESLYLFAGRRHAEGGDELISTYIEIMQDLRATFSEE